MSCYKINTNRIGRTEPDSEYSLNLHTVEPESDRNNSGSQKIHNPVSIKSLNLAHFNIFKLGSVNISELFSDATHSSNASENSFHPFMSVCGGKRIASLLTTQFFSAPTYIMNSHSG